MAYNICNLLRTGRKYLKKQLETQWKFPFSIASAAVSSEQKVSMKDVVKMRLGHDSVWDLQIST